MTRAIKEMAWASLTTLLLLSFNYPAAATDLVPARVAGQNYAVPKKLLPQDGIPPPLEGFTQTLTLQPVWPGLRPPPAGHKLGYEDGLLDILLQDLSATTRVEALASLPNPRARFLTLWRDSTVEQFSLPHDFHLAPLTPQAGEAPPGLLRLGPLPAPQQLSLYADGPPGHLVTLMLCKDRLSCQLWWMRGESAVQVTFAARFLPDWAAIQQETTALLDRL